MRADSLSTGASKLPPPPAMRAPRALLCPGARGRGSNAFEDAAGGTPQQLPRPPPSCLTPLQESSSLPSPSLIALALASEASPSLPPPPLVATASARRHCLRSSPSPPLVATASARRHRPRSSPLPSPPLVVSALALAFASARRPRPCHCLRSSPLPPLVATASARRHRPRLLALTVAPPSPPRPRPRLRSSSDSACSRRPRPRGLALASARRPLLSLQPSRRWPRLKAMTVVARPMVAWAVVVRDDRCPAPTIARQWPTGCHSASRPLPKEGPRYLKS
jgi:hypothetical protein